MCHIFWVSKNILLKGDKSQFSNKICMSQSTEKLCKGPFCVLESHWYRKRLWLRKGEVVSRFSVKIVLSKCQKIRRRTLLRFTKFRLTTHLMPIRGVLRFFIEN